VSPAAGFRPDRPVWGWRFLAWTTLIVAGLMSLPNLLYLGPTGWALTASNWIAIGGTFAYAYGRRARLLLFWRVFALLFSFYTVATLGKIIGRVLAIGRDAPSGGWMLVAATLVVCVSVCVALLRYSELLRGRQRRISREYERIFA